jgi:hypothetical protein
MYARPDTRELAEVLMDLEAEPEMRLRVIEVLKASLGGPSGSDAL